MNLCAQNEQLNRIKRDLNESHDKVTITEKLVDRYVSAIGWISSTMKWNNSVKLDIKDSEASFNELGRSVTTSCGCTTSEGCCKSNSSLNQPVRDLFNHTTQGLSSFLASMKNNRVKTDLISNMIVHQNTELDKINSSALSLRDRVSTINKTLKE
ncbi:conserved hypothetical protein [Theileria orientalis strain Shintoku]|uniref:t-SNARE coiled-coil homology domain-containing protein n=1 Tax=Theileria orientalis strain Shintoku TaxID=869250 RepID=J4C7Q9_THEOR|nr:conserved hypothetical protein [Theileria orientalis strain Shintoku]BAM39468.1 conserved hypothetical protein [Theileria orientalis strain Shintoku]|eukprot:XP_009689769.1 conserved hypothetical protein [Theileria orientalis strain Shintoku]